MAQPRNRDQRFAFAASLAEILVPYVDSFTGVAEPVAVDRGRDVRYRFVDAPQIWVPNTGGVDFLKLFGRSTRFRRVDGDYPVPPSVPLLGRWLTFFANSAEMPGSSLLLNAVQALGAALGDRAEQRRGRPARRPTGVDRPARTACPAPRRRFGGGAPGRPDRPPIPTSTTRCSPR